MIQIYFSETDTILDMDTILFRFPFLSQRRREKLLRMRSESDRMRSLVSELLIRKMAGDYLSVRGEDLHFDVTSSGKPFLPFYRDYHFSISHTESAILVAASDKPVGADIEHIRFVEKAVFDRVLSPDEKKILLEKSDTTFSFLEIWTRKEAFVKWSGGGFHVSPEKIDTTKTYEEGRFFTSSFHGYIVSIFGNIREDEEVILPIAQKDILQAFP